MAIKTLGYKTALAYLESLHESREKFTLKKIKKLVELAKLDLSKLKVIHVTGTNGKGSVVEFIARGLREEGFKVATYTSPHLLSERERIRVNGKLISRKKFAELISFFKPLAKKMRLKPTYFDFFTAFAFKYFLDEKVDFAVVEVGLGGRLDSTNILQSLISVITNVSLEHTEILGKTVEKIAWEKAGIIKEGQIVVTGAKGKTLQVIKKIAREKKSVLVVPKLRSHQFYQELNAGLAVIVLTLLGVKKKSIDKALKKSFCPGRMQLLKRKSLIVLDVAHNPGGAKELVKAVKLFRYRKLFCVFAVLSDKDVKRMLRELNKVTDEFFISEAKTKRAMKIKEIVKHLKKKDYAVTGSVAEALALAEEIASRKDLILVTGSHYTVGEAMKYLKIKPGFS